MVRGLDPQPLDPEPSRTVPGEPHSERDPAPGGASSEEQPEEDDRQPDVPDGLERERRLEPAV